MDPTLQHGSSYRSEPVRRSLWDSIRRVFDIAVELPNGQSDRFIADLIATNPELGCAVKQLLDAGEHSETFLQAPLWSPKPQGGRVFSIGQVLANRYEIEAFLGSGGVGEVYRAFDRVRKLRLALKTLRPELANETSAIENLIHELNIGSIVSHDGICRVYDVTIPESDERAPAFVTMELLNGQTLSERIHVGRVPLEEASEIVRSDLCSSLRGSLQTNRSPRPEIWQCDASPK